MTAKVVVGLLTAEQEFQQLQAKDARDTAARLGLEAEVLFAEGNAVMQIQQLFRHIHAATGEHPVAIVVESAAGDGLAASFFAQSLVGHLGRRCLAEEVSLPGGAAFGEIAGEIVKLLEKSPPVGKAG